MVNVNFEVNFHTFDEEPPCGGEFLLIALVVSYVGELEWWTGYIDWDGNLQLMPGKEASKPEPLEKARQKGWLWAELPGFAEQLDDDWIEWPGQGEEE